MYILKPWKGDTHPERSRAKDSGLHQRPGASACCVAREQSGAPGRSEDAMRHVEGRRDRRASDDCVTDGNGENGDVGFVRSGGQKQFTRQGKDRVTSTGSFNHS